MRIRNSEFEIRNEGEASLPNIILIILTTTVFI